MIHFISIAQARVLSVAQRCLQLVPPMLIAYTPLPPV
jgi:hypothetical protein